MDDTLHRPAGCLAAGPYQLCLTPGQAGWSYAGLRVLRLPAGGWHELNTGDNEMLVLPLAGSATVDCAGQRFELAGRAGCVRRPVPTSPTCRRAPRPGSAARTAGGSRCPAHCCPGLLAARRGGGRRPAGTARYGAAAGVPVELRGAGSCSRQVNGFCMPGTFAASRLLACEVLTPAGNWSSYPPHKHDQDRPGETVLEEIYYFEIAAGPPARPGRRGRDPGSSASTAPRTGRLTCWPRSGRGMWC